MGFPTAQRRLLLLSVTAAVMSLASSVTADGKVFGGNWCNPEDSGETGFSFLGFAFSSSASGRTLTCPIMRDRTDTTGGLDSLFVEVHVGSDPGVTACTFYSVNSSGTVLDSALESSENVAGCEGNEDCLLTWSDTDIDESSDPGYYYLMCYLNSGNGGRVNSYRLWEQ